MISALDNLFPWFGDMVDLGGNILLLIVLLAALIGSLVLERIGYLLFVFPGQRTAALELWQGREKGDSAQELHLRQLIQARLKRNLGRNIGLTRTLIKLCPLLGLLGTVLGMLEVFDAVAATGANNPRSTASGVSKATVTTMAGMVVAIASLLAVNVVSRMIADVSNGLNERFALTGNSRSTDRSDSDTSEVQHA
ncbi:MAG: MotA/TolQ/ExbB proton channel family protein [Pseudomonadota bacterium]